MGYAIAAEAARRGAIVTLVTGPTTIEAPAVHEVVKVRSAAEMHQAVVSRVGDMGVVVMAAAVADYTPAERAEQKVAKAGDTLTLVLRKTPDILGELGQRRGAQGGGPRGAVDVFKKCRRGTRRDPRGYRRLHTV